MNNVSTPVWRGVEALSRLLSIVSVTTLFLLMVVVFASVFFRYVLNSPLLASEDYLSVLLGLTVFAAYPAVCRKRAHITVDVFTARFERYPRFNAVRCLVVDLFVVGMTVFIALRIYEQAAKMQRRGSTTSMAEIPLAPVTYIFAALVLGAALMLVLQMILERRRKAPQNESSQP